jgi:hypothetical protein
MASSGRGDARTAQQGSGRLASGPDCCIVLLHNYSMKFQIDSNLNWSKNGLLVLENFQIKYGRVGIEIGNKFPHWSFSTFKT